MALTTVAAPVGPDETLLALPPSKPERFQPSDFIAAALVFAITLGVYVATLAPNVTLEDSGELITAAAKFGVGHPPGYPLWTMCGFALAHLFPFGNLAWRVNLLCALFGAASNATLTLLVCHSGRWLLQRWAAPEVLPLARKFCFYAGVMSGLVIGFSDVMWSQAVISAVHGTLNALFVTLVLLTFYLWMLEPQKKHRLILSVFVFSLGLTNHHTLVQVIPGFLLAALLIQFVPNFLKGAPRGPDGIFFSVLMAVNLFSLSLLVYISWLSGDEELQTISQIMAKLVFFSVAAISFFYLKEFRLRLFLLGATTALAVFAYGYYEMGPNEENALRHHVGDGPLWQVGSFEDPGWLQGLVANARANTPPGRTFEPSYLFTMLALASAALGLLFTSSLDRRLVIGVFIAGWVGLMPYSYERIASATHPPMNWGVPATRSGFYYSVSREQYPKSLPNLIKSTFGKLVGVVPKDAQLDATIGLPDYFPRLWKTFYYYGYNLQANFTVPLIFLTLATLLFIRRCDWPQINWFIFLGSAFFLLGFMLLIIAPQEAFDFERNLQYKVFHIQSHCIFVVLMGYGVIALMVYLHELMPEIAERTGAMGFGIPALFLSLLPLWSNFDACSQAGHWFGWAYGTDMMRPMDKNAVYFGGSDPGRFVPTFMAFVESQQDARWKHDASFDRRDVTVVTQNALCDTYYSKYIRDQYDPRFQPKPDAWTPFERWLGRDQAYPKVPVTCVSEEELLDCWNEYRARPEVAERIRLYGPSAVTRAGVPSDVFEINGVVAQKIFEKNKKDHTFYLEQSSPITWMYPYLLPSGLIFKLNSSPMTDAQFAAGGSIAQDHVFWDAYSAKLLADPRFRLDADAILTFSKLAFWHADLYRWRHQEKEQEYWLKMALQLCPQLQDAVGSLVHIFVENHRFDEAIAIAKQAAIDDPRNDIYPTMLEDVLTARLYVKREAELRTALTKSPYDVQLNLDLAELLQEEGKLDEVNDKLRLVAGLTNWTREGMSGIIQYYVEQAHNPAAAIVFLEERAKIDPNSGELIYSLATLHAGMGHKEEALKYLKQALDVGGTNALISARIDPRLAGMRDDPRFKALLDFPMTNATSTAATNERVSFELGAPLTNASILSAPTNSTIAMPGTNGYPAQAPAARATGPSTNAPGIVPPKAVKPTP